MFCLTNFELMLLGIVEGFISLYMTYALGLISNTTQHEVIDGYNSSSDIESLALAISISSIVSFANSIWSSFAVYKIHADGIREKLFLFCFQQQYKQLIDPNHVHNKNRRILNLKE